AAAAISLGSVANRRRSGYYFLARFPQCKDFNRGSKDQLSLSVNGHDRRSLRLRQQLGPMHSNSLVEFLLAFRFSDPRAGAGNRSRFGNGRPDDVGGRSRSAARPSKTKILGLWNFTTPAHPRRGRFLPYASSGDSPPST